MSKKTHVSKQKESDEVMYIMTSEHDDKQKIVQALLDNPVKKDILERIYVFVMDYHGEKRWLYDPLQILNRVKKTGFIVRTKQSYVGLSSEYSVYLKPNISDSSPKASYNSHISNLKTMAHDIQNDVLLWTDSRNQAIVTTNEMNFQLTKITPARVDYTSLLDVLTQIDPYIPKLYADGTLKPPTIIG